jgi:hypothetical protein
MSETVVSPPKALVNLAQKYSLADQEVERLEEKLKEAKKTRAIAESKLVDQMTTEQVQSFRTSGMGGFRCQVCVYPNVTDREALGAWVKKRKLDWLYTTNVNGQKLKGFVKELLENGKTVPPGVDPFLKTEIRRFK